MKVECWVADNKENVCVVVRNAGDDTDDVIITIKAHESGEWREQCKTIVDGSELIKAVQRAMRC